MGVQVPERATFLRTIWSEMARISSHLLWLGLMADAFGFESLIMQRFRVRERVLDVIEEMTGGRVIFGVCTIGGVRRDVQPDAIVVLRPENEWTIDRLRCCSCNAYVEVCPVRRLAMDERCSSVTITRDKDSFRKKPGPGKEAGREG